MAIALKYASYREKLRKHLLLVIDTEKHIDKHLWLCQA